MTSPSILPGIHPGLSREQYDGIEAINQSALKKLGTLTPAQWKYLREHPEPPTEALAFGQAVHLACYEPSRFAVEVVAAPDCDRRTKAGKEEWERFNTAAAGKIVMSADEYATLGAIQRAVMAHPAASKLIAKAGDRECSAVWRDDETGTLCKARLDQLTTARNAIIDLKTTRNAAPGAFERDVYDYGYHFQAAFYADGIAAIEGHEPPCVVLIAVDKEWVCEIGAEAVAVYEIEPAAMELGRIEYRRALALYADCVRTGKWPGYSSRIEPISVPAFRLRKENIETGVEA